MDNTENLKKLESDIVDKLISIRDDYKKTKEELFISLRKDVLLVELKDMLMENHDFYSLKNAIEDYIQKLEGEINGGSK